MNIPLAAPLQLASSGSVCTSVGWCPIASLSTLCLPLLLLLADCGETLHLVHMGFSIAAVVSFATLAMLLVRCCAAGPSHNHPASMAANT
jgi:hypothetical protein